MFKLLLIGRKCGSSDEKVGVLALDSLQVVRFLGVTMGDAMPDRAIIARYRSQMDEYIMRELIEAFNAKPVTQGYVTRDGQMIDASFTLMQIERNTHDENAKLKVSETPAVWEADATAAKLRQKDLDSRWTKKHLGVEVGWKLIRGYVTTPANV